MNSVLVGVQAEWDPKEKRSFVQILFPEVENVLTPKETVKLLTAGISVIIRSVEDYDSGVKSHELLEMVLDDLKEQYVDPENFVDTESVFWKNFNGNK
jgi:hypothetical protein